MSTDLQARRTPGALGALLESVAPGLAEPRPGEGRPRRKRRWTLLPVAVGLLVLLLALIALTTGRSVGGALDPRSAGQSGSRALAELLRARGIAVDRGTSAGPGTTVLVPFPEVLRRLDQALGRLSEVIEPVRV